MKMPQGWHRSLLVKEDGWANSLPTPLVKGARALTIQKKAGGWGR